MDSFAALRQDGSVVSWGSEASGGNSCSVQAQLQDVQEIFATSGAFAALRTDDTVVTWGLPGFGGSINSSDVLMDVKFIHGSAAAFAAVRHNGSIVTWGAKDKGGDSSAVQSAFATF